MKIQGPIEVEITVSLTNGEGAYLLGGPLGILTSMVIHPWMVRRLGRKG